MALGIGHCPSAAPARRILVATKALRVRLEAKSGKEDAVEQFLLAALPLGEKDLNAHHHPDRTHRQQHRVTRRFH